MNAFQGAVERVQRLGMKQRVSVPSLRVALAQEQAAGVAQSQAFPVVRPFKLPRPLVQMDKKLRSNFPGPLSKRGRRLCVEIKFVHVSLSCFGLYLHLPAFRVS